MRAPTCALNDRLLTLTSLEIFDEYARRQYVAKAPQRNPFGVDEEPKKFNDMDTFTKVRILQQLSTWTLGNADRIREKMPEQKDIDQTSWVSGIANWHPWSMLTSTSASKHLDGIRRTALTLFLMTIAYTVAPTRPCPQPRRKSPSRNPKRSLRKLRVPEPANEGDFPRHLQKVMQNRRKMAPRMLLRRRRIHLAV